jgi:hypothetical protein
MVSYGRRTDFENNNDEWKKLFEAHPDSPETLLPIAKSPSHSQRIRGGTGGCSQLPANPDIVPDPLVRSILYRSAADGANLWPEIRLSPGLSQMNRTIDT